MTRNRGNGVNISFSKDFEVELVGDFSSELSPKLEMMLRSKNSFTVDEFLEAIIVGYDCGITYKALMVYLEKLDFDISVSERIKKELIIMRVSFGIVLIWLNSWYRWAFYSV